ncbi:alpha-L-rhamnosidase [bacterium]|nr:MAG: alpha-L-rhamnosidase [bacterium]
MSLTFSCDDARLQSALQRALTGLRANVRPVHGSDRPVLIEGAEYRGIWLECGLHEASIYGMVDPQVAIDSHRIFFRLQHEDGYLPCWIREDRAGTAQIQMVVPIAATALETYRQAKYRPFMREAYEACVRWDGWLTRYRDTRGTGLCEAFCEYDTGHDNSPRFHGLPKACPDGDARKCSPVGGLPYVAPDLSATLYGGRGALAEMAHLLGLPEAEAWKRKAEETQRALLAMLFDPESDAFFDLDKDDRWVRIRGDAITRVLGEHVVDQPLFERIYRRHLRNEQAFWTPYPLASIAANDPAFVRPIPHNSWGGASQALTALRAPRWFEHYGKWADLTHLMSRWVEALARADGFRQQIDPWTGEFTPGDGGYSPAMLVLLDFMTRMWGVRRVGETFEWGLLPLNGSFSCGEAEVRHEGDVSELFVEGRLTARIEGACRMVTDSRGRPLRVIGASSGLAEVRINEGVPTTVAPDETVALV